MKIKIYHTPEQLGEAAAHYTAEILKEAVSKRGGARIVLSTGASQFETLNALIKTDVEWDKVEMFHLDEYVGLPASHKASFRKYLIERFINKVNLKAAHLVDGNPDCIKKLTDEINKSPIDIGLIGVGENAHIAFNDPPADFNIQEAYIVVDLCDTCKQQQVNEKWFEGIEDVPEQAISMTVHQIMKCRRIVSCVPHAVKANAVKNMLENDLTNMIPATILKQHEDFTLFLDAQSASLADKEKIKAAENGMG